jgi:hypothetical protein
LKKKRLCVLLIVILLIMFGIYVIVTLVPDQISFSAVQNFVSLSLSLIVSGLIVAIGGGVIVAIIVHFLFDRKKGIDLELIHAVAFYVADAYDQMRTKRSISTESWQDFHNDIRNSWGSFREQIQTSKLPPEYKSLFSAKDADAIVYVGYSRGRPDFGWVPYGTVLTGLTGDLMFTIKTQQSHQTDFDSSAGDSHNIADTCDAVVIYIPPGFIVPPTHAISTTSGAAMRSRVFKASPCDRYGPGWTAVYISADAAGSDNAKLGPAFFSNPLTTFLIKGVTAPSVAGKYFFKIARVKCKIAQMTRGEYAIDLAGLEQALEFIPAENWPSMLVKGELDSATITGTIRYGGRDATLYGQPMREAGMVWAKMTMKTDPYTGATIGTCPDHTGPTQAFDHSLGCYDAWGFFNSIAEGHFEVEGLAPGVYDLYAEAAGYPLDLIASGVRVLKGQSLHFDGHLDPGPIVHGTVFSKHKSSDHPWLDTTCIRIELYDDATLHHVPNSSAKMVSWSPLPSIAAGQENLLGTTSSDGPQLSGADSGMRGPQDVGPAQRWLVERGTTPFQFEFGVKGEYGAPRDLDGMIPQLYATWVNGLTPGRYYVRAWVVRYVQSMVDGSTFQEYYFDVAPSDRDGDKALAIELHT